MTIEIDESQRQVILLALAHLAIERPGWKPMLKGIAEPMNDLGGAMFTKFYMLRLERVTNSLPDDPTNESLKTALRV